MLILETDRLSLHQFETEDATFLLEVMNHPDYHRFIGNRNLRSVEDAEVYINEKMISVYEKQGFGFWMARLRESGERAGFAGVLQRDVLGEPDVGYALHEKFWRQGLAQEATRGVLKYARETLNFSKVCAITDVENHASINVLLKCGFEFLERRRVFEDDDELNIYTLDLQSPS